MASNKMQYLLLLVFICKLVNCMEDMRFINNNERFDELNQINDHGHDMDPSLKEKRCHDLNLDLYDHMLGAVRNPLAALPPLPALQPLQIRRRDILKKPCEDCLENCKKPNNCHLCEPICKRLDIQQSKDQKDKEIVSLASRANNQGQEETGLSEDQDRYYTVGSFGPGPKQDLLARLLNIPRTARLEKLIVLAKNKSKLKANVPPHPVVIDTAHVFTTNDGTPASMDLELHGVKSQDGNLDQLTAKLNKELDAAFDTKKKIRGDSHLTPTEIDKVIEHAIGTPNSIHSENPHARAGTEAVNEDGSDDHETSFKKKKKKYKYGYREGEDHDVEDEGGHIEETPNTIHPENSNARGAEAANEENDDDALTSFKKKKKYKYKYREGEDGPTDEHSMKHAEDSDNARGAEAVNEENDDDHALTSFKKKKKKYKYQYREGEDDPANDDLMQHAEGDDDMMEGDQNEQEFEDGNDADGLKKKKKKKHRGSDNEGLEDEVKHKFREIDEIDSTTPNNKARENVQRKGEYGNQPQSFQGYDNGAAGYGATEHKDQYANNQGGYGGNEVSSDGYGGSGYQKPATYGGSSPSYGKPEASGGAYQQPQGGYQQSEGGNNYKNEYGGADENQYQKPSGYQQPEQQYGNSESDYQQPSEGNYEQSGGGYQQPEDGYQQSNDGYQPSEGGYQQPEGGYQQPEEGYGGSEPSEGGYQQPNSDYQEPSGGYQSSGEKLPVYQETAQYSAPQPEPEPSYSGGGSNPAPNSYPVKSEPIQYQEAKPKTYSQQANAYKKEQAYKPPPTYETSNSGYRVKEKMDSTPYGAAPDYKVGDPNTQQAAYSQPAPQSYQPPPPTYSQPPPQQAYSPPVPAPTYTQPAPAPAPAYAQPQPAFSPPAPPPPPPRPQYYVEENYSPINLDEDLPQYAQFDDYVLGSSHNATTEVPNDPEEKAEFFEDKYKKLKAWLRSNMKTDPEESSDNPIIDEFTNIIKSDLTGQDVNKTTNTELDKEISDLISESLDSKNATQLVKQLDKLEEKLEEKKNPRLGLENFEQFKKRFEQREGPLVKLKNKLSELPSKDAILGDRWNPNKIEDALVKLAKKPLVDPKFVDLKQIVSDLKTVPNFFIDKAEKVVDAIQPSNPKTPHINALDNDIPSVVQRNHEVVGEALKDSADLADGKNDTVACKLEELLDKLKKDKKYSEEVYVDPYYPEYGGGGYRNAEGKNLLDKLLHPLKKAKNANDDTNVPTPIPTLPELIKDLENIKLPTLPPLPGTKKIKIPQKFPEKDHPDFKNLFRETPTKTLDKLPDIPEIQVNGEKATDNKKIPIRFPQRHNPKFQHLFKDTPAKMHEDQNHLTTPPTLPQNDGPVDIYPKPNSRFGNMFREAPVKTLPGLHEKKTQKVVPDAHIPLEFPEESHPKFKHLFRDSPMEPMPILPNVPQQVEQNEYVEPGPQFIEQEPRPLPVMNFPPPFKHNPNIPPPQQQNQQRFSNFPVEEFPDQEFENPMQQFNNGPMQFQPHQQFQRMREFDNQQFVGSPHEDNKVDHTDADLKTLGKLLPANDKIIEDGEHQMYFIGDGVKLPLKMVKKDGNLHLSVDMEKLCQCNKTLCYNSTSLKDPNPMQESNEMLGLDIPNFDELRDRFEEEENHVQGEATERNSDLFKRSPNKLSRTEENNNIPDHEILENRFHNYKNDIDKYYENEHEIKKLLREGDDKEEMDEDVQKRVGLLTNVLSWMKNVAMDDVKQKQ